MAKKGAGFDLPLMFIVSVLWQILDLTTDGITYIAW